MKNIQEKLISVIITCYNNELYIEECIKNVLNNKSSNIEIILINWVLKIREQFMLKTLKYIVMIFFWGDWYRK